MEKLIWHTEKRKVKDLVPYPHNPRQMTEKQVADLTASLERFNLVELPAINLDRIILAGHQRIKILMLLGRGEEEIEVRVPNRLLNEDEVKEYNVRSNKNTGEWNYDVLANAFDTEKLIEWGFSPDELNIGEVEGDETTGDDEVPDTVSVTPFTVLGDLYEIVTGSSTVRLLCGDSVNIDSVKKLLRDGDVQADLVWTDPPWNVDYGANQNHPSWKPRTILNDSMSTDDFKKFMSDIFATMHAVSKDGAMVYVVMSAQEWGNLMLTLSESGFHWSSTIIWKKDRLVLSRKDYHTQYEPIWYGWKEGAPRLCPLEDRQQSDVWDFERPSKSELHPTTKPVELIVRSLKNSSKAGDAVLDLFNGSGSTGVACLKTSRHFFGVELDPKYVDVAVRRWVEFLKENGIGYTLKRNGEAFELPVFNPEGKEPEFAQN